MGHKDSFVTQTLEDTSVVQSVLFKLHRVVMGGSHSCFLFDIIRGININETTTNG